MSTVKELSQSIEQLQRQLAQKDTEIRELRDAPLSEYSEYLIKAIDKVLPIVGFAMANLPPLATAGWPADELEAFIDLLERVVAIDKRYASVLHDWRMFAREARASETERKIKKAKAPRARPASADQLKKMATDYDKEFGAGSIARRVASLTQGGKG